MLGFISSESQGTELLSRIIEAYLLQYREMPTLFVTPAIGTWGVRALCTYTLIF